MPSYSMLAIAALVASANAFSPIHVPTSFSSTAVFNAPHLGAGGMADTRDPEAFQHEDARKSISAAPSFEEYLKMRDTGGGAAPAPAPAAPAPAAPAPAAYAPPAPAPAPAAHSGPVIGAGGMADTRDPAAFQHEDARKSISAAPSFEEYLKMRDTGGGAAPAAAAPAAPAPAAYAAPAAAAPAAPAAGGGGGGDILGTLGGLQGPGQVWGAEGIAVGKEEADLKGYDGFGKFVAALQSTGVANELGGGPYTVFAPVDSALETYEAMRGPLDAAAVKMHIVPGNIPSSDVSSADLTSIGGTKLTYRYAVRKHFVNDAIIGEKTFGPFDDYPVDVACSNGVIHAVGLCLAM